MRGGRTGGANVGSNEGAHEGRTRRVQGHEGGADVGVCVASYSRTPPPRTLRPKTPQNWQNISQHTKTMFLLGMCKRCLRLAG